MILLAGIISRGPDLVVSAVGCQENPWNILLVILMAAVAVVVTGFVVWVSNVEHRVPVRTPSVSWATVTAASQATFP